MRAWGMMVVVVVLGQGWLLRLEVGEKAGQ